MYEILKQTGGGWIVVSAAHARELIIPTGLSLRNVPKNGSAILLRGNILLRRCHISNDNRLTRIAVMAKYQL
jgi:hypothetical protein